MSERGIAVAWVEQVLEGPEKVEPDRHDLRLTHAVGKIAEYDDRVLHVVYNSNVDPWQIITAYFDRSLRDKL